MEQSLWQEPPEGQTSQTDERNEHAIIHADDSGGRTQPEVKHPI
jgi:hypothetical protein